MINFTDMTGLASSAVAIAAMSVQLPGVARLQKSHLAVLLCALVVVVLIPFGGLPLAAYVRGVTGDLSMASLVLLMLAILKRLPGRSPLDDKARTMLLLAIALAAAGLYPMALGIGYFDPYSLGYGNPWFLGGLLLAALVAAFRQRPAIAWVVALSVLAWSAGWYESANLWDYLLDPLLAIYAFGALLKQGVQAVLKMRRS